LRESHILLVFERSKVSSVRSQIELRNGILVSYSAATGRPMAVNALFLIGKHLTVKGFFLGDFDHVSRVLPAQIEAAPLVASGALRVPVAAVYPMPKIKEAVTHLLKGGKILIDIAGRRESTS
jgi:NADPH:quinone reductase-like Zn-dependent oxidoreductase